MALPRNGALDGLALLLVVRRSEWVVNHHRDSLASHIGHFDFLSMAAVAENESIGRVRYTMLEKMLSPIGPPPAKEDD